MFRHSPEHSSASMQTSCPFFLTPLPFSPLLFFLFQNREPPLCASYTIAFLGVHEDTSLPLYFCYIYCHLLLLVSKGGVVSLLNVEQTSMGIGALLKSQLGIHSNLLCYSTHLSLNIHHLKDLPCPKSFFQ